MLSQIPQVYLYGRPGIRMLPARAAAFTRPRAPLAGLFAVKFASSAPQPLQTTILDAFARAFFST